MSLGGILNSARSAISSHRLAVQVASHNIANADTEGYSRQRVELTTAPAQYLPQGAVGNGVVVADISRTRDSLADVAVRRESGKVASYGLRHDVLAEVESIFGEPSENGIASTLDRFWNSWSDLANYPTSTSAKTTVRQRGEQVVQSLNEASSRLGDVEANLRTRLGTRVDGVNRLAGEIANLNVEVVRAESGGKTASDLRDLRDRLIDDLSALGTTRVTERSNGGFAVTFDGVPLVDAASAKTVATEFQDGRLVLTVGGDIAASRADGSTLAEMVRLINEDFPAIRDDLDNLARGLVAGVNALHTQGKTAAGDALTPKPVGWDPAVDPSLVDFFEAPADPSTVTARNFSLSTAVRADASVIAAGYTAGGAGDNRLALDVSALRVDGATMSSASGPTTFDGFYRGLVTRVAHDINSAENSVVVHESLSVQALNRRESISGVSTDEELIQLMQSQQAYVAATKLVTAVDEMTQTILNMV